MSIVKEFKEFAMKGNVLDMAVGIIIGGAFGKIVSSAVSDILMPPLGLLLGKVDFKDLKIEIQPEIKDAAGEVTQALVAINYGAFLQVTIDFILIALAVFLMIKAMNNLKKKEEAAPAPAPAAPVVPVVPEDVKLLTEIRDLLKK
jgi:large conductance mechanosensitive channel